MGRKSEAREKLIEQALILIWENSYHAVGVNEICSRAEVRPGSFYYFFPSKEALALAAMEQHWQQAKEEIIAKAFDPSIPPLQRIVKLLEQVYQFHAARQKGNEPVLGCAFGSFVGELGRDDRALRERIHAIFMEIGSYIEQAIREAREAGDLQIAESEVTTTAHAVLAYYEGILLLARAGNDAQIIQDLSRYVLKLVHTA